jgi:arylsulfatase A-like enzyme
MKKLLYPILFLFATAIITVNCDTEKDGSEISSKHPNVIYIYADDLGYGELGSYGQEKIKTPHLDRLAAEGIRFTQHYTGTPVCAPARCMLLTGQHGGHAYIRSNYSLNGGYDINDGGQMPLPSGTFTIGHLMQEAGYTTGAIGKWGLGSMNTTGVPEKQGFDYFYGYLGQGQAHGYYPTHLRENDRWDTLQNDFVLPHEEIPTSSPETAFEKFEGKAYAPDKMTEKALDFLDRNKGNPFFLYLPYTIPHVALQIPKDSESYKLYEGKWDTIPYYGDQGYTPTLQPLATYAAMITQLDAYVGQIMEKIKELNLDEETLIMFSSDNGTTFNGGVNATFFNSVKGLRGLKMDLYEGGIRMPFIARWPGHIPAGKVTDHISAQYDMMATLGDLLNTEVPPTDGISMMPTLLGKPAEQKKHDYLYFEYPAKGGQLAIRLGNLKAVKTNVNKLPNSYWEIYDLKNDPTESKNIASEHAGLMKKLCQIVRKEHVSAHLREWEFVGRNFSTHPL